jgi:hypothetical protein
MRVRWIAMMRTLDATRTTCESSLEAAPLEARELYPGVGTRGKAENVIEAGC